MWPRQGSKTEYFRNCRKQTRRSTLVAASDPVTGKSEFRYRNSNTPPVIRVQPGSVLNVEYKNELAPQSKEDCFGHPCMQMTNLHFHGLHVSPNAPQDDVLDMMASPGETLHYSVQVPPQQPPGLYWYHTHSHGESYVQDLDGMSGAIVVEGIERYVPEVLKMRERILVLRDFVLPNDAAERKTVMASVAMQTTQCGTAPKKAGTSLHHERKLSVPRSILRPGERQFWRIVNASPDLYADLELDSGSFEVVALDGMPLAYHDPSIRKRSMSQSWFHRLGEWKLLLLDHQRIPMLHCAHVVSIPVRMEIPIPQWFWPILFRRSSQLFKTQSATGGAPVYITFSQEDLKRVESSEPQFVVTFTEDKQGFYINGQKFEMNSGPMLTVDVGALQHWRVMNPTEKSIPFTSTKSTSLYMRVGKSQ